jgi:uncharacterized NAD-dependent epimerase/dehydratase family protein
MNSPWTLIPAHRRIALLTEGFSTPYFAKTAMNLLKYRTADVIAVIDESQVGRTALELFGMGGNTPVVADLNSLEACDAIYLGIATPGGKLPEAWRPLLSRAISAGLDVVSGLHDFLVDDQSYASLAAASGSRLIDVRRNCFKKTAKGAAFRPECLRVHTVGNDCSIGKMVTTLELQLELANRGHSTKFIATGQTGIMIAGDGAPIDCVISDFVNGAVEELVTESQHRDYLLIEGQGSLAHPAFSAVTAGLLHGCAPQGLLFCYEAGRTHVKGLEQIPIVPIEQQMAAIQCFANLRHPCKIIGISINTRSLSAAAALQEIDAAEQRFGLPACDVYRQGAGRIADACEQLRRELIG